MMRTALPADRLKGDPSAACSPQGSVDRDKLSVIAVERTRMPMCVTDPRQPDNPIVLANKAFLDLSGYLADEIIGRNCRFLQGRDTDPAVLGEIRAAVAEERDITVDLLNYHKDGTPFWNQLFISPVHDDDGTLLYYFSSSMDITRRRQAQDLEAAEHRLLREVDHRAKNVLALVQGIVRLSRADDAADYAAAVQGRVDALARAHALLAEGRWRHVPIDRLVRGEAEKFGSGHVSFDGPEMAIGPELVQPIALMLHEMLTNAAQHGALLTPGGHVSIRWGREEESHRIVIDWRETGGAPPLESRRNGFGLSIISAIVDRQLRGRADFTWHPHGLQGRFSVPSIAA